MPGSGLAIQHPKDRVASFLATESCNCLVPYLAVTIDPFTYQQTYSVAVPSSYCNEGKDRDFLVLNFAQHIH